MSRSRVALVLGVLIAVLLPASRPTAPVPVLWAEEAVEWIEARDEAARLGIPNLLRFVASDVVIDHVQFSRVAVGREAYAAHVQHESGGTIDEGALETIYLDTAGMVVERDASPDSLGEVSALDVDGHGMTIRESATVNAWDWLYFESPGATAARTVAGAYLQAWSSPDPAAVRDLYSTEAVLVDALQRVERSGADAIVAYARSKASDATSLTVREGGSTLQPTEPTAKAVFFRWLYNTWSQPEDVEVLVLYTADDGSGCPDEAAVALRVFGGLIVEERRYHKIDSVRRCWDTDRLPRGWWTSVHTPAPYEDVVTGTVQVAGQAVEIHNGSAALERLVAWAMERFGAAGLPAPVVSSVTFDQDMHSPQCAADRSGLAVDLGDSTQVYVCIAEAGACEGEGCAAFVANARLLMLHELAHAWMIDHLDDASRQAFMDHLGVEEWSSPDVVWHDRGVEQAAQIIAWGLMDETIALTRLGDRTCEELVEAFRLLTGAEPARDACRGSGGGLSRPVGMPSARTRRPSSCPLASGSSATWCAPARSPLPAAPSATRLPRDPPALPEASRRADPPDPIS